MTLRGWRKCPPNRWEILLRRLIFDCSTFVVGLVAVRPYNASLYIIATVSRVVVMGIFLQPVT